MTRSASSASLGCTARRMLPRPSTDSGKIDCGTSEETTDRIPWASRRLRTISASMPDEVRNTTTRSGNGLTYLVDFQQDHCHVVMLRCVAHEGGNLAQHPLPELGGRQVRMRLNQLAQPRFAEAVVVHVHRLADPIRKEQVEIAGPQRDCLLLQEAAEHLAVVQLETDDHPVRDENADAVRAAAIARDVDQRRVS